MPTWTEEQKRAIEVRNADVLVSAAAGSGKTAVLTERILELVCDPLHPVDIDRLLVVTFTKAAAGEMKSRIAGKLEDRILADPENRHLRRQAALLSHAQVTTIDSFCLNVVRNHFTSLSLDPDFRVAEEGEQKLLRADVMKELLEETYEKAEPDFLRFVESYCAGKTDAGLEDTIEKLCVFAESYPDPEEQLKNWCASFEEEHREDDRAEGIVPRKAGQTESALSDCRNSLTDWQQDFVQEMQREAGELLLMCREGLRLCRMEDGPLFYEDTFLSDKAQLERICSAGTLEEILEAFQNVSFARLSSSRKDAFGKEEAKQLRDAEKKRLQKLQKDFGRFSAEELEKERENGLGTVRVITRLASDFLERYAKAKRERNLLDFGDLEHMALQILTRKEDGVYCPSEVAKELSEHYAEILIDEYQDSNRLQETILAQVAGVSQGKRKRFHVGDVKQSIYQFRLARPDLFLEKYHSYGKEGEEICLELSRNFRSRSQVLDDVNRLFFGLMRESLGGIEYDARAALYPGRAFPGEAQEAAETTAHEDAQASETNGLQEEGRKKPKNIQQPAREDYHTEFLVCELTEETEEESGDEEEDAQAEKEARELEAAMVAQRIRELTNPETGLLVEGKDGALRPARYGDVAILLRSFGGYEEALASALTEKGIPVQLQSRDGYFRAYEVQVILNTLQLLDNPRQDIPLAAVLKSPLAGLSTTELARMKGSYIRQNPERKESEAELWDAAVWYAAEGKEESLKQKLNAFLEFLNRFRHLSVFLNTGDLLGRLLQETAFPAVVLAMPGGEQRKANLDMLLQKAADYDATSYRGLFHFVRYIEKLQKYQVDFGEASAGKETEDAVRIMTIHKSKGLEFPICFVCGTGRKFNEMDAAGAILMHPDWGLAMDFVDPELRIKRPTFRKKCFASRLRRDFRGEELRILYVAATRAKEKLIFTTARSNVDKWLAAQSVPRELLEEDPESGLSKVPETFLKKANGVSDWLIQAWSRDSCCFRLRRITAGSLVMGEIRSQQEKLDRAAAFARLKEVIREENKVQAEDKETKDVSSGSDTPGALEARLHFCYPYEKAVHLFGKLSVSELKKKSMEEEGASLFSEEELARIHERKKEPPRKDVMVTEEDGQFALFLPMDGEETLPAWEKMEEPEEDGEKRLTGADRGNAYHRVLELYPYGTGTQARDVRRELQALQDKGKISELERKAIYAPAIAAFLQSSLGTRMEQAHAAGSLHRESRFVMGLPAREVYPESALDEPILLQGIIDAWFEEEGSLVLVDYKTDYVQGEEAEEILRKRYQVQLDLYRRALEQMTGRKVKESWLYSFSLGRMVSI